jgi:twitching motility two-component system response regulator PilH
MDKLALKDIFARMLGHKEDDRPRDEIAPTDAVVMVVDDSRTMVRALQIMLEREGYATLAAFDGQQAVEMAKLQKPDCVIMDIVMPKMNGFEATRAILNNPETKAIPVIMVSGTEMPSDQVWGMRLGAKGFLAKPIRREDLVAKVRSVITIARRAQARAVQDAATV